MEIVKRYDFLIVGAGLYGAVCAYELSQKGYDVLVIDKRDAIGGNVFTEVQVCPFMYGKTAQGGTKDLTGCRKAYLEAGTKRGEHMRKLYGDVCSCGLSNQGNKAGKYKNDGTKYFRHKLKPVKVGVRVWNKKAIDYKILKIFAKYAETKTDKITVKGEQNG